MKNLSILFMVSALMVSMFLSCSDDTDPITPIEMDPVPVANFDSSIDGKTVSFTSTSTDASTFEWDFGDGNTSSVENPTHTYEGNGSYVAKLTVSNSTGSDDKQAVLEIINVAIDGDFSEWSTIDASIDSPSGTVTTVKVENLDNNKLFLYIEGTADLTPLTQIQLNVDNDRSTGAQIEWRYLMPGEDILIEGSLPASDEQFGSIYECAPCDGSTPGDWNWGATPFNENIADFLVASEMKTVGTGLAYELSLDLTALPQAVSEDAIGIGYLDMSTDTWDAVGAAPTFFEENDNPEGTMFTYSFK